MPKQILNKKPSGVLGNIANTNNTPTIIKHQGKFENNFNNNRLDQQSENTGFDNFTAEPKLQNKSKIIENNQPQSNNYLTPKNHNQENKFNKQGSLQSNLER